MTDKLDLLFLNIIYQIACESGIAIFEHKRTTLINLSLFASNWIERVREPVKNVLAEFVR